MTATVTKPTSDKGDTTIKVYITIIVQRVVHVFSKHDLRLWRKGGGGGAKGVASGSR